MWIEKSNHTRIHHLFINLLDIGQKRDGAVVWNIHGRSLVFEYWDNFRGFKQSQKNTHLKGPVDKGGNWTLQYQALEV